MEFEIVRNDIAEMNVDAVVLPANKSLTIGSGASYSIFNKAGIKDLQAACDRVDKSNLHGGDAVKTLAYGLKASVIIHAIVPKLGGAHKGEYDKLKLSYFNSLKVADDDGCKSIAFPLLGAGNNGFDEKAAYYLAEEAINSFEPSNKLQKVYLVIYNQNTIEKLENSGALVSITSIDSKYIKKHPNGTIKILEAKTRSIFKKFLN